MDLDPQSNLSHSIMGSSGYLDHINAHRPTIEQILQEYSPPGSGGVAPGTVAAEDVILTNVGYGRTTRLDLIPSRLELSRILMDPRGRKRQLARILSGISDRYDLIIIDCAPTESVLTQMAYFASRFVVVPVKPEFLATVGLPLLDKSLTSFGSTHSDHKLEIAGLLVNDQSEYTSNQEKEASVANILAEAKKRSWNLFTYRMPYSRSFARALRSNLPIARTRYARRAPVKRFLEFKDEFLRAVGLDGEKE